MVVRIGAPVEFAVVDAMMRPRLWATAWATGLSGPGLSRNTIGQRLRHLDAFYKFCDAKFGNDALDDAISDRNAVAAQLMLDAFYLELTANPGYTTTAVQCWGVVRAFIRAISVRRSSSDDSWMSLDSYLHAVRTIRQPSTSRFRFVRALPDVTLIDLLEVARPGSKRNPFTTPATQLRNWLIVNLLLLCGLRRGEMLLLTVASLKHDVDPSTGALVYWLDVTTTDDEDDRSTRPSIKTRDSHRQVPVSQSLAAAYERYVTEARIDSARHGFLLTSRDSRPLSAESVNKALQVLTQRLSEHAVRRFQERTGHKRHLSPHDLRHTCASARFAMFLRQDGNRELALQRMRAFFGWSRTSDMPELYARAAIQDDLLRTWNDLFEQHVHAMRALRA